VRIINIRIIVIISVPLSALKLMTEW